MNILRSITAITAAIFIALSTPALAETWHRADTDNFVILTTGSQDDLKEWALKFERFDALMRMRYRVPSDPSPNRLTIYLLGDSRDVMKAATGRTRGTIAGYYSSQLDGSYAVTQRTIARRGDLSGQEVMFHEYGHHFMYRYFPFSYPGWYREGFAEYYATTEFDKEGNWNFGKPPLYRGSTLGGITRQISFKKLITTPESELSGFESYQVYTRGWLLVHMMHSDAKLNKQLNDFLLRIAKGEDREKAAEAAFGDLDELERRAEKYMSESPQYIVGREPIEYSGRLDIVQLDEIDSDFETLRLANRRPYGRQLTRDRLRKLAEKAPDRAHIWNELADAEHMLAHAEQNKLARKNASKDDDLELGPVDMRFAIAAVDQALKADPNNAQAHSLKAEFLMDIARHNNEPARWEQGRNHALKANQINPDNPQPLSLYYDSFAEAGDEIPEMARAALTRAFELAPEVDELRVDYALDLALQGEFDSAREVVGFLIASPHSEKRGKLALLQIDAIANGSTLLEAKEIKAKDDEKDSDAIVEQILP